jgi:DNA polymerase family B
MQFLESYRDQAVGQLSLLFPGEPKEKLEEFVEKQVDERFRDRTVDFKRGEIVEQRSLLELTDWLETEKPIMTGYGAFYKKHEESINKLADMVDYLLKSRKVYKKEMFKHVNDEDRTTYNNFDLMQKTMKLLANSFYGATVEKNSTFFNENFGPSITYNGVVIITTAVNAFETFMSNNFTFRTLNDVMTYFKNVMDQHYSYPEVIDRHISKKELLNYVIGKWESKTQFEVNMVAEVIRGMEQSEVDRIYYKNNLYEFFENSAVQELLGGVVDKGFLNPEDPPEGVKEPIETLWGWLNDWVLYNHLNFYRFQNANEKMRKTVLVVDTDSNFLMLDPFYKYFKSKFPEQVDRTDESRVSVVNVATYFLAEVIKNVYWKMTTELNVPHDKREIINMKNEFFYKRLMMTRNKKSYAGELIMQEGHMFEKPKMDVKGLAIRKVSVNRKVRDYFSDLLKDKVLSPDEINLGGVFGAFNKLQKEITNSLKNGDITYLQPGKVNELESYKTPYQIGPLRGAIAWNALFPEKEIVLPTKVNLLKLTAAKLEDLAGNIPMEQYAILKHTIFDDENLAKYGFQILSMPKSAKKIPDWLVQFIDVDAMVNDHVKSGIIILESLGFKTLDVGKSQFPTNILEF